MFKVFESLARFTKRQRQQKRHVKHNELHNYSLLFIIIIVVVINILSMVLLAVQKMTITDASFPSIFITKMCSYFKLKVTFCASILCIMWFI